MAARPVDLARLRQLIRLERSPHGLRHYLHVGPVELVFADEVHEPSDEFPGMLVDSGRDQTFVRESSRVRAAPNRRGTLISPDPVFFARVASSLLMVLQGNQDPLAIVTDDVERLCTLIGRVIDQLRGLLATHPFATKEGIQAVLDDLIRCYFQLDRRVFGSHPQGQEDLWHRAADDRIIL